MKRFVIEGVWSGYTSAQSKIVHRTVHPGSRKKLRAWAEKAHCITYTDGTGLFINVRECAPSECVREIHGYTSLIEDCAHYGVTRVDALPRR